MIYFDQYFEFKKSLFDVCAGAGESGSLEQDKDCRRRAETEVRHHEASSIKAMIRLHLFLMCVNVFAEVNAVSPVCVYICCL